MTDIELTATPEYLRVSVRGADSCIRWSMAERLAKALEHRRRDVWICGDLTVEWPDHFCAVSVGRCAKTMSPDDASEVAGGVRKMIDAHRVWSAANGQAVLDTWLEDFA